MLNKRSLLYKDKRRIEYCKAETRAKVEHPFRVIKHQFGYVKVRFRGLMKNNSAANHAVRPVKPVDRSKTADGYG